MDCTKSDLAMKPLYLEARLIAYKNTDIEEFKQDLRTWINIKGFQIENENPKEDIKNIYFDSYDYQFYKAGRIFCLISNIKEEYFETFAQTSNNNNFISINGITTKIGDYINYIKSREMKEPIGGGWITPKNIIKPTLETTARYHLIEYKNQNKKIKVRLGKIHYKKEFQEREENIMLIRTKTFENEFLDWMLKNIFTRRKGRFTCCNNNEYTRGMSKFVR